MLVAMNPSPPAQPAETPPMRVDFVGETHELAGVDTLTFGRQADLVIDENPYLHRVCGRLLARNGVWWIVNEGKRIVIHLHDLDSPSTAKLAPGAQSAVLFARSAIRFTVGQSAYEIEVTIDGLDSAEPVEPANPITTPVGSDLTVVEGSFDLTPEQLLLIVALSETRLRNPHLPTAVPPNAQIAHELGWSRKKFDGKLDRLCRRFARMGVPGLTGTSAALASDRRRRLVEYAVDRGLVTSESLSLLDEARANP